MRSSMPVLFAAVILLGVAAPTLGQPIYEDFKLLASDGEAEDLFGFSIAIDSGIVAVGAIFDGDNGSLSGSVYLFDVPSGAELFKLLPNDGAVGAFFGSSMAIDNGVIAVGADGDSDNGFGSGSAYVFDVATGTQIAKLLSSDGAEGDTFGISIAIDNGIVAVGATQQLNDGLGSAYVFDAATGAQIAKLLPSDGAPEDRFAHSIAIDNGIVAVGADGDSDNGDYSGSVYLFDAFTGVQIAKLLPNDGAEGDSFGISIAIDNGIIAIAALGDDDNGDNSGSAYLFDATTGAQIAKLLPSDGAENDKFGNSIAIDNGIVAVGAVNDHDNGYQSGSAYFFDVSTGAEITKLLPSDGAEGDSFGSSIAIDNGVAAVGALHDQDNGIRSGSAYVFDGKSNEHCLDLTVENLIAGKRATFTIARGSMGAKGVTAYGTQLGDVAVGNFAGYCATFGIEGVTQNKVIGGYNRIFDANREITFGLNIPDNLSGLHVLFQSAQQGTCPNECMSNLVEMVVQ